MNATTEQKQKLTIQMVRACVQALRRLQEIRSRAILTKGDEEEAIAAKSMLDHVLTNNADEFLGAWLTMRTEYSNLINGFAGLLQRAVAVNEIHRRQSEVQITPSPLPPPVATDDRTPAPKKHTSAQHQDHVDAAASAVISGEAPAKDNVLLVSFGEATKPGSPVEPSK